MPSKEQQRTVYRTAKGREIDMHKLVQKNELVQAVGNAKVNARGDKLGPGGVIVKRREEISNESSGIPGQINTSRPQPVKSAPVVVPPVPAPAPVFLPEVKPVVSSKKDIEEQDPEGMEE
jgi:hypothetical protein